MWLVCKMSQVKFFLILFRFWGNFAFNFHNAGKNSVSYDCILSKFSCKEISENFKLGKLNLRKNYLKTCNFILWKFQVMIQSSIILLLLILLRFNIYSLKRCIKAFSKLIYMRIFSKFMCQAYRIMQILNSLWIYWSVVRIT